MKEKKENKKENIKLLKRIIYNLYWKEGLSARKIAKKLGYGCSTIFSFMKKHNIPRRRCGAPPKINISKDELKTLYVKMKKSTVEIAKMFNVSRTVVFHTLKKYGIRLRDRIKAVSDGSHKKAIHIKKPFSGNPLEKEYLMGLAEDLAISRDSSWTIKVSLSTTRQSMEKLFKQCFGKYGPIWMFPVKDENGNYNWRLVCTLDKSFSFLLKNKRNYNISLLSKKEFFYRLAGIIDAEGSIILRRNNKKYIARGIFIGNENKKMILEIAKKLKELGFKPRIYKIKERGEKNRVGKIITKYRNDLWALMILKKEDLRRLIDKLPLRHREKKKLILLLKKSLKMKFWSEIENEIKKVKMLFEKKNSIFRQRARLLFKKLSKSF